MSIFKASKKYIMMLITFMMIFCTSFVIVSADLPEDAKQWTKNKNYYKAYNLSLSWEEAKEYCEKMGGHLATITSIGENNFVKNLADNAGRNCYWLGANSIGNKQFTWITGEKTNYTNWTTKEPDHYQNTQDAVFMFGNNGTGLVHASIGEWGDINSDASSWDNYYFWGIQNFGFVCEWEAKSIKDAVITLSEDTYIYDGSKKEPDVTVKLDGKILFEGEDYKVTYSSNKNPGTATVKITGKGRYTGTVKQKFSIYYDISNAVIKVSKEKYEYNGVAKKPSLKVKVKVGNNNKNLKKGRDYEITYKNNVQVGTAQVIITGINKYTGTAQTVFKIVPRKPTSVSVKSKSSGSIMVSWKGREEADYYEIEYSTSALFINAKKIVVNANEISFEDAMQIPGNTKKTTTIEGLKTKKKYYIRIRACANNESSSWTKKKSVKTKK